MKRARDIAALYVDARGIYSRLVVAANVWGIDRDARYYDDNYPVVAHPPCAGYCKLRHLARKDAARDSCAPAALSEVQFSGGVLEHPAYSQLWKIRGLPTPGGLDADEHGGISLAVNQFDFGHIDIKPTWLYLCAGRGRRGLILPSELREFALLKIPRPDFVRTPKKLYNNRKSKTYAAKKQRGEVSHSKKWRIATTPKFARYLISIAQFIAATPPDIGKYQ